MQFRILFTLNICYLLCHFSTQNYRFLDVDKLDHSSGGGGSFVLARLRKHCQYEVVVQVNKQYSHNDYIKQSFNCF